MCGLCGLIGTSHWAETAANGAAFADAPARPHRAERAHRARVLDAMLAPFRMRVADFEGSAYVLRGATGRSEVVADLAALWAAVERLRGEPLDPLDPDWQAALGDPGR